MKKYIRIMRVDHWIKNMFILPGVAFALLLAGRSVTVAGMWFNIVVGMLSTCLIASSNYVINEWLDAQFDKFHPVKKHRSVVENNLNKGIVYVLYFALCIAGLGLAALVNWKVFAMELWLWVMGVFYNVKPMRTKDIPVVDVLSESINNAIRLLIGWFIITNVYLPPISIVIGYWMGGAFLMDVKRFSEYRMIADKDTASKYRKSFAFYNEDILLCCAFFYGVMSMFFVGIFLIKYRVEFVLMVPVLVGMFCYYLHIAFRPDSAAQAPEKLYREKGLMCYVAIVILIFLLLLKIDLPMLHGLLNETLLMAP